MYIYAERNIKTVGSIKPKETPEAQVQVRNMAINTVVCVAFGIHKVQNYIIFAALVAQCSVLLWALHLSFL